MAFKRMNFSVTPTILMVISITVPLISAGLFDGIVNTGCAAVVTGLKTGKCFEEFRNNYKEFKDQDEIPKYVACCGASILKSCLQDEVVKQCGEEAKGASGALTDVVLKSANEVTGHQLDCDWDEWYFDRKSPVCWPIWAQAIGGIVLLGLLLGSCCCCCCCCMSKRRGRGRTYNPVPYKTNA